MVPNHLQRKAHVKTLAAISLKNRSLIALISIVAVIFGSIATISLKKELFPSFENPQAMVTAQYPGASPETVEREVTNVLEGALGGVQSVEEISSTSSNGASQIMVTTKYGINSDDVVRELQRAVSQVQSALPDGVTPTVFTGSVDDFPVLVLSVSSSGSIDQLTKDLDDIAIPDIQKIDGVRDATAAGAPVKQVSITVDEDELEDENVSIDEIASLLQSNGVPVSAGQLRGDDGSAPVEVGKRLGSVADLENLYVNGEDGPVKLSDVADVKLVNEPITSISRSNGENALTLQVLKKPDANTVDVATAVQRALPDIAEKMQDNPQFVTVFDQSPFINESIRGLVEEGSLGLVFAVVIILVFLLSFRATVITAISIPLSLLITLIAMWQTGYTLNILTLAALTMSIGRVVDDSIVVIEAIRRRQSLGGTKFANILAAVGEVSGAITASTLTTVAVFIPLAFVSGQTGELFRPFALTVTIALLSSLLVALTIVPVLAYWFLRARESRVKLTKEDKREISALRKENLAQWKNERKEVRRARKERKAGDPVHGRRATSELPVVGAGVTLPYTAQEGTAAEVDELASLRSPTTRLQKTYVPVVRWATRHPVITVIVAVLVLAGTLAMTPLLKTEFLGDTGEDSVQALQVFDAGVDLQEAGEQAKQVEQTLADTPGVESYQFSVGDASMSFGSGGGSLEGSYFINLEPDADTAAVSKDIQERFDNLDGVGDLTVLSAQNGPGSGTIDYTLTSNDPDALQEGVERLTDELRKVDDVQDVTNDLQAVQPVIEIDIDSEEALDRGLTEAQIGQVVQRAMRGQNLGEITIDAQTHAVRLFDGNAETKKELEELEIPYIEQTTGPAGLPGAGRERTVELQDVADVNEVNMPPVIRHSEGLRSAQISVTPSGDNLGAIAAELNQVVDETDLPSGVTQDVSGLGTEQADAFKQLGLAMLAAVLIVFVILVATFKSLMQPLILLVSIPFAATGSIALSLITNTPIGLTSLIGLLMLIGIVVTNAIVLIDLINQFRTHGVDLRTAVINGARLRFRPILMTAAATVFALLPMALGITGGGIFISKPLAIVVIGGLVSSTLLTVILVPVLYQLVEGVKERRAEKRTIKNMARSHVIDKAEARS